MAHSADVLTASTSTHAGVLAAGLGGDSPALWTVIIAAVVVVFYLSLRGTRR